MAEYWYNTNFHTSIAMTPFEALYGNKPVPVPLGPYLDSIVPAAVDMVTFLLCKIDYKERVRRRP